MRINERSPEAAVEPGGCAELRVEERVTGPKGDTETSFTLPVG
jgi:hypothetical protein